MVIWPQRLCRPIEFVFNSSCATLVIVIAFSVCSVKLFVGGPCQGEEPVSPIGDK